MVIDTTKDKVVQTIESRPWPSSNVGYESTSIAMTNDGHLLVTLGRANAVAVYQYHGDPKQPVNYIGLQTVGMSPTVTDHRKSTGSSRFTPRRLMHPIPFGNSTAPSIC